MRKVLTNRGAAAAAAAAADSETDGDKKYTFATGRGNFPSHVIASLKARGNWT